jgi:hypothetical protein
MTSNPRIDSVNTLFWPDNVRWPAIIKNPDCLKRVLLSQTGQRLLKGWQERDGKVQEERLHWNRERYYYYNLNYVVRKATVKQNSQAFLASFSFKAGGLYCLQCMEFPFSPPQIVQGSLSSPIQEQSVIIENWSGTMNTLVLKGNGNIDFYFLIWKNFWNYILTSFTDFSYLA